MRRLGCVIGLLMLLLSPAAADPSLPGLVRQDLMLPITLADGHQVRLETMILRPDRPGRFPLVLLVHGTIPGTGDALRAALAQETPASLLNPAVAFAQRGYVVASIMRRGFGRSDGPFAETLSGPCDDRDYLAVARIAAEDVTGALAALRGEPSVGPWVESDRVLLMGHSTGGFAVTAAAADNPAGVVGVLNFEGAHGSVPGHTCSPDHLVADAGIFGRTARIPALWVYSENDRSVPPALGRRMFDAYAASGAPAQFQILPSFGVDGHAMVPMGPSDAWRPAVEGFLNQLRLPTAVLVELPARASIPPPTPLNAACAGYFDAYVKAWTDAKAYAWNRDGHCSSVTAAQRTVDDARREAMRQCVAAWKECSLYAVG
ncbi:dienelactone hydrolase [Bradyrhizobium sp. INPA01-394B]|uniref:Dienelactone hydrolase n=1 Tax=Bradyrhizobium campsiandrae TaxID=1729892 RepID=A0ABR7U2S0_9BRAD|nr:CocE/NonD family hydrolase [Bradyrhizobium campsiandrae]MBC9877933.1 dienelactone hydrolase [Bradyrhizobium campsiandrae]MBC9978277.1 dienelactone hydrolase [Bradyrhizobium campsiandrae]